MKKLVYVALACGGSMFAGCKAETLDSISGADIGPCTAGTATVQLEDFEDDVVFTWNATPEGSQVLGCPVVDDPFTAGEEDSSILLNAVEEDIDLWNFILVDVHKFPNVGGDLEYGASVGGIVDTSLGPVQFDDDIIWNYGNFLVTWTFDGVDPIDGDCAAGGAAAVATDMTITGSTDLISDEFTGCDSGQASTVDLPPDDYTIAVQLVDAEGAVLVTCGAAQDQDCAASADATIVNADSTDVLVDFVFTN